MSPASAPDRFRMPLPAALLVAAASGPLFDAAFPDKGWWPLALPAVALVLWTLRGRRFWAGTLVGFVFGAAFFFPHIEWAALFLGPVPWSALALFMAIQVGLGGGVMALAWRWIPRVWPGVLGRLLLTPAVLAGLWTGREAISSTVPWGGFSWGRVAFSQSEGAFTGLFPWLGVGGTTFALVAASGVALCAAFEVVTLRRECALDAPLLRATRDSRSWALVAAPLVLLATLAAVPGWPTVTSGTLRVGAVQGDGKTGYFDPPARQGDNLQAQIDASLPILDDDLDVLVWPEGSSDLDPMTVPVAARVFDQLTARIDAPLVAGIITSRTTADGVVQYFNESTLWMPGEGPTDYYDKKHPVPFGEYVPERAFFHAIVPDLIDLIQREYTPGTTDPVLDFGTGVAGIAICFDIVDDDLLRDMVRTDADVIFAQTNNADFGETDENVQQLAIARIRAMELSRSVVNISTVGTSAIIRPDGTIEDRLAPYEPGAMVDDVTLSTAVTPAALAGSGIEKTLALGALALLIGAGILGRRRRA